MTWAAERMGARFGALQALVVLAAIGCCAGQVAYNPFTSASLLNDTASQCVPIARVWPDTRLPIVGHKVSHKIYPTSIRVTKRARNLLPRQKRGQGVG